jgi:hypothetical protein
MGALKTAHRVAVKEASGSGVRICFECAVQWEPSSGTKVPAAAFEAIRVQGRTVVFQVRKDHERQNDTTGDTAEGKRD